MHIQAYDSSLDTFYCVAHVLTSSARLYEYGNIHLKCTSLNVGTNSVLVLLSIGNVHIQRHNINWKHSINIIINNDNISDKISQEHSVKCNMSFVFLNWPPFITFVESLEKNFYNSIFVVRFYVDIIQLLAIFWCIYMMYVLVFYIISNLKAQYF